MDDWQKDRFIREQNAEIERLREALRKRTQEADDGDHRAHTAHNTAIDAALERLRGCGYVDGDAEMIEILALKK